MAARKTRLGKHPRIDPRPIEATLSITDLVDGTFLAYNAARLREACHLFTRRMLADDVTVGVSLTGALTPAGLGVAAIIPLIEHGFVDWIVSTGANLYHDLHYALNFTLRRVSPFVDDRVLYQEGVIRIYDVLFPAQVLLDTDRFIREFLVTSGLDGPISTRHNERNDHFNH